MRRQIFAGQLECRLPAHASYHDSCRRIGGVDQQCKCARIEMEEMKL